MLGSLIFALRLSAATGCRRRCRPVFLLEIRVAAYSLTTRTTVRYCVGAMPTCAEKK